MEALSTLSVQSEPQVIYMERQGGLRWRKNIDTDQNTDDDDDDLN